MKWWNTYRRRNCDGSYVLEWVRSNNDINDAYLSFNGYIHNIKMERGSFGTMERHLENCSPQSCLMEYDLIEEEKP